MGEIKKKKKESKEPKRMFKEKGRKNVLSKMFDKWVLANG